uniref:Uncharacterized protein n=1 Tax=Fundulus heteroclitus TaxID=8078 RepID=A0A3Q2P240_FUNHE
MTQSSESFARVTPTRFHTLMSALSSASSSSCCNLRSLCIHPGLQLLDLLLAALHCYLLRLIQAMLQVFDGLLHVFLHALQVVVGTESIIQLQLGVLLVPAASLRLQGALQGVHHPQLVPLGLLHLLVFLGELALNFRFHLVELQLGSKDLALLVLKGSLPRNRKMSGSLSRCQAKYMKHLIFFSHLCFLQSSLYLGFLLLQLFAHLLQLMDAFSSLANLLGEVRNFLCFRQSHSVSYPPTTVAVS